MYILGVTRDQLKMILSMAEEAFEATRKDSLFEDIKSPADEIDRESRLNEMVAIQALKTSLECVK